MTDEARAQAVCLVLLGESGVTPEAVATLAGEFAAVRRQEQKQIVTWLRARANWALLAARGSSSDVRAAVFDEVILAIEAGAAS